MTTRSKIMQTGSHPRNRPLPSGPAGGCNGFSFVELLLAISLITLVGSTWWHFFAGVKNRDTHTPARTVIVHATGERYQLPAGTTLEYRPGGVSFSVGGRGVSISGGFTIADEPQQERRSTPGTNNQAAPAHPRRYLRQQPHT